MKLSKSVTFRFYTFQFWPFPIQALNDTDILYFWQSWTLTLSNSDALDSDPVERWHFQTLKLSCTFQLGNFPVSLPHRLELKVAKDPFMKCCCSLNLSSTNQVVVTFLYLLARELTGRDLQPWHLQLRRRQRGERPSRRDEEADEVVPAGRHGGLRVRRRKVPGPAIRPQNLLLQV